MQRSAGYVELESKAARRADLSFVIFHISFLIGCLGVSDQAMQEMESGGRWLVVERSEPPVSCEHWLMG